MSSFGSYGLPESSLLVYATGLAEVLGGLALVAGVLVRPVAALLTLVMLGAIAFGGLVGGNPGSLTLAPALLIAAAFVLWSTWPRARRTAPYPAEPRARPGCRAASRAPSVIDTVDIALLAAPPRSSNSLVCLSTGFAREPRRAAGSPRPPQRRRSSS